jgi:curved DNA-binding protein CbpA
MSFDPYDVLGVARGAGAAALKSAYRARVQTAHPDRGGDPEAFILITRAFGVLADPEARRLYDETGAVDEDAVKSFRRDVATILADMFDAAVASAAKTGLQLEGVDFIAEMTTAVKRGLAEAKAELGGSERALGALERLRNRIRRKTGGDNLFASRIAAQMADRTADERKIRRRILILDAALVELGNYESEVQLIAALEAAT